MRSPSELPDIAADIVERLRQRRPRVHCITNAVARGEDLEAAALAALTRLRRCEQAMETNHPSGANEGAGAHERRSSMETQQFVQEQELKAERVQGELAAVEETFRISLKAERVQGPASPLDVALGALNSTAARPWTA